MSKPLCRLRSEARFTTPFGHTKYLSKLWRTSLQSIPITPAGGATRSLVMLALVSISNPALAEGADEFLKQRIFEHEQCANVCQIEYDEKLFKCMPYRKDKEKQVPQNCAEKAEEKFDKCMNSCPVDPRIE